MAEEIKSALDAMNAALAGEGDETELETPDSGADGSADADGVVAEGDDQDADGLAEGDAEGSEPGDGKAESVEPEGEGLATAAEVAAKAAELGISTKRANGQFKSAEELKAEVTAKLAGGKEGDKPVDGKGAKKEPDPVNDPIDKTLKPATQERIRTLIERTKEATATAEKATQDFNYLVQGVQATGATPEQYGETLSWLALFNSGDPKQQEQALEIIESVADRLATLLGKDRQVTDPLKAHPDLLAAIQAGKITREYANEMARTRNQGQFRQQITTAASAEQQRAEAARQEVATAQADLNALEEQLMASDTQYEAKKAIILPTLKVLFPQIRPSAWKDAFQKAYREVKVAAPAQRRVVNGRPNQQPLRANKTVAGGGGGNLSTSTEPTSALDAVNAALAGFGK